jgi:hypothetical protein
MRTLSGERVVPARTDHQAQVLYHNYTSLSSPLASSQGHLVFQCNPDESPRW